MEKLKMFVGGKWKEAEGDKHFLAFSPSTGEEIAQVAEGSREDARQALQEARKASEEFRKWSVWDRASLLQRISIVVEQRKEVLAHALTLDQGKPYYTEAIQEVESVVRTFSETAEQIKWIETSSTATKDPYKRVYSFLQPKGVYAVITPWNFPLMVPTEFIAPGLGAGNTIVWVPAPTTTVCSVKFAECFEEAGVPKGVINLVTGMGNVVGDEIVSSPYSDAIAFCGSSATGKLIAERGAGKPLLLELGGNGPTVVLKDADLDYAAQSIAKGCFTNAGQICSATERILVQKNVHDALVEKLTMYAKQVVLGDPFDTKTTMGPLNNYPVIKKNEQHVADSQKRGSTFLVGGKRATHLSNDLFFEPTVIIDVKQDSLYNLDETFGPVAPVMSFSTQEELLKITHQNKWGLASAIYTNHLKEAISLAEKMPTGLVNINENSNYWEPHIPFGGVAGKSSGIGRVGGKYAIQEMSDLKTISIDLH
ncbi:aldehyde dehydrogenase family protein [Pseudalkalibacillus decolorationis]|uniref:aldehyde dehydrogenase family protein n=1 Tax=Pseudalkalibacillus decolorationis TaxID=163879 RepID=UPI002148F740|nr:aldehyde dehydrogenase family protein [Pseudalkalibacillus decolorationis]